MLGILSFVGFTLLVAVIAYLATRKTNERSSDGYFLGGQKSDGWGYCRIVVVDQPFNGTDSRTER